MMNAANKTSNPKIFNGMTSAQYARQATEHRTNGKYAKVNPCYRCGKSAGVNYWSIKFTDGAEFDPKRKWHDTGLVMCKKCCTFTDNNPDVAAAEVESGKWAMWQGGKSHLEVR